MAPSKLHSLSSQFNNSSHGRNIRLPNDMLIEILSQLSVKSLCRFRCVSKHFNATISDRRFVESHYNHTSSRPGATTLVITGSKGSRLPLNVFTPADFDVVPVSAMPIHSSSLPNVYRCENEDPVAAPDIIFVSGVYSQSLNGLMLVVSMSDTNMVCNPITGEYINLPPLKNTWRYFLGHDPINNQYKVLALVGTTLQSPRVHYVFVIGESTSWRKLSYEENVYKYLPIHYHEGLCIDGVLYFMLSKQSLKVCTGLVEEGLVAFDVRLETFRTIAVPDKALKPYSYRRITQFNGHIAVIDSDQLTNEHGNQLNVWVLRDLVEFTWVHKLIALPTAWVDDTKSYTRFYNSGFLPKGEITSSRAEDSRDLHCMNPGLGTVRRIQLKCLESYKAFFTIGAHQEGLVCPRALHKRIKDVVH